MKKSILELYSIGDGLYRSIFKNNHGRMIYLLLSFSGKDCQIEECFYIDREKRPTPKKLKIKSFEACELLSVIGTSLDKSFESHEFLEAPSLSNEEFISSALSKEKYNILIMLKEGAKLKTIFKNKYHRSIYFEIELIGEKAKISECRYCDKRGKDTDITPYRLITIYFEYDKSHSNLLNFINSELEGGFSDVLITEDHTITLDRPICGSI